MYARLHKFRLALTALVLTTIAVLAVTSAAFAEGDEQPAEPPVDVSQEAASAEEPPAPPAAPAEQAQPAVEPVDGVAPEVEAPASPVVEEPASLPVAEPVESAPAAPVEKELPAPEEPNEESVEEPVEEPVAAEVESLAVEGAVVEAQQSTAEEQVTAQYTGLTNHVYFYDTAAGQHWYDNIDAATDDFAAQSGKGLIYVSNKGSAYTEALLVNAISNLTGIVFLDYYATEAAKYDADDFDAYDSSSWAEIGAAVTIADMPTFTLLGFKISTASDNPIVSIDNDTGASGTLTLSYLDIQNTGNGNGVWVKNHTGTVKLTAVKADGGATGCGAALGSVTDQLAGAVTITNSSFVNSGTEGLIVFTTGLTTLTGVSVTGNSRNGAQIEGRGATVKNSVFSNNSDEEGEVGFYYIQNGSGNLTIENAQFNNNYHFGLFAYPVYGNISLKNVHAYNNGSTGAFLDTCYWSGSACTNTGSGNITIAYSAFVGNGHIVSAYGLYIDSARGSVTLTSVGASGNGDYTIADPNVIDTPSKGAIIFNHNSPTKSPVTITDSNFDSNTDDGLTVHSLGLITLKNVSASNNNGADYGAWIENQGGSAKAGVKLTNSTGLSNNFNNNTVTDAGLRIDTFGSVSMSYTYANGNSGGRGALISNDGSSSAASVTVNRGGFDGNTGDGLYVSSKGTISVTLTDCSANNNSDSAVRGVRLYNHTADSAKAVTLDGGSYYNNGGYGIEILSDGVITVKNVDVQGSLNNHSGAYLSNADSPKNSGITVTTTRSGWTNLFNSNKKDGLEILSKGNIQVYRTNAEGNDNRGISLVNDYSGVSSSVTVTTVNVTGNCTETAGDPALYIDSNGNISLKSVSVQDNGSGSVAAGSTKIYNNGAASAKTITISNSQFSNNKTDGLMLYSIGKITLTNVTAENNAGIGAELHNDSGTVQVVTVTSSNFNNNQGANLYGTSGLYILSLGNVTISKTHAHDNSGGDGLQIDNSDLTATGSVSVTCTSSSLCNLGYNGGEGLSVATRGTITLKYLDVQGNSSGASLDNSGAITTTPKNISISSSYFSNNTVSHGLYAASVGSITLSNVDAGNNATYGAQLVNNPSSTAAGVSLSGSGDWDWYGGNGDYGLNIQSKGKVTVSKIDSSNNNHHGLFVDNHAADTDLAVTISNVYINNNVKTSGSAYDRGLYVVSRGAVSMTSVWINDNGDSGGDIPVDNAAYLANTDGTTKPGVTLTSVSVNNNYGNATDPGNGLTVYSKGSITIKNIEACNNSGIGAGLYNENDGSTGGITISRTGSNTNNIHANGDSGLVVYSNAAITISYLNADENGDEMDDYGVYLENQTSYDDVASTVSVSNSNITNSGDNDADLGSGGLRIMAEGAVTLSSVGASGNVYDGISINNTHLAGQNVSLNNVDNFGNSRYGLNITTAGHVTLRDMMNAFNGDDGAYINTNSAVSGNVTFSGTNYFCVNSGTGLNIFNNGTTNLSTVTAERNGENGISVVNTSGGAITASKIYAYYNGWHGFSINANNTVSLNTIYALNNGTDIDCDGVRIDQNNALASMTIANSSLHGNTDSGLEVETPGDFSLVVITNIYYYGNDINNTGGVPDVDIHS